MMFSRFYESFYLKVLVNIVIGSTKTTVYIEMLKKQGLVFSDEHVFDTAYLSTEMYQYITGFTKESPFFYISILDHSASQGVIPTCSKQNVAFFHDLSASEYKCYKDKWIFYTAKTDMYEIEKVYSKLGVDFIFSPFVVLANFFKDKIDSHLAMFILVEENHLSLSVFNNSELLYGDNLGMEIEQNDDELIIHDDIEDIEIELDEIESIDLDDIDAIDDIDELDDFGDIADLDSIEEIDEFAEARDIEEELLESEDDVDTGYPINDADSFNEDYQRFSLIQSSIKNFYKNDKYKSEFIETVYIADSIGVSSDLKKYFEEEMFLNVYVRHIDLPIEVCEVAKMELS